LIFAAHQAKFLFGITAGFANACITKRHFGRTIGTVVGGIASVRVRWNTKTGFHAALFAFGARVLVTNAEVANAVRLDDIRLILARFDVTRGAVTVAVQIVDAFRLADEECRMTLFQPRTIGIQLAG
jgi:hypothetical protein